MADFMSVLRAFPRGDVYENNDTTPTDDTHVKQEPGFCSIMPTGVVDYTRGIRQCAKNAVSILCDGYRRLYLLLLGTFLKIYFLVLLIYTNETRRSSKYLNSLRIKTKLSVRRH